jgi:hypothetical protein
LKRDLDARRGSTTSASAAPSASACASAAARCGPEGTTSTGADYHSAPTATPAATSRGTARNQHHRARYRRPGLTVDDTTENQAGVLS